MTIPKDFGFGDEERMVRDSARKLLDEVSGVEQLRALVAANPDPERAVEARFDADAWARMVELGWTALAVPEEHGGLGMKRVAVAALVEEAGRHALPSPLVSTLLATVVLAEAAREAGSKAGAWLERIAGGASATLAFVGAEGDWDPARTDVGLDADGSLSGSASYVQDAGKAEILVVAARDASDALALYAVPRDAPGLTVSLDAIVDLTRDQGHVRFEGVRVGEEHLVAAPGRARAALERGLAGVHTLVAADLVGASEWLLQTTAEYAKAREQFGRPIGFFQAVKHPIVDMMVDIDQARSLVYAAASAHDESPGEERLLAHMAKALASETADFCSGRAVQLHGGVAFTWECDVHLYFKRNLHNQALYGDAATHRARVAELLLDS